MAALNRPKHRTQWRQHGPGVVHGAQAFALGFGKSNQEPKFGSSDSAHVWAGATARSDLQAPMLELGSGR